MTPQEELDAMLSNEAIATATVFDLDRAVELGLAGGKPPSVNVKREKSSAYMSPIAEAMLSLVNNSDFSMRTRLRDGGKFVGLDRFNNESITIEFGDWETVVTGLATFFRTHGVKIYNSIRR